MVLLISLKKSFSKSFFASVLNLVLMLMFGFNHAFLLNGLLSAPFLVLIHDLV